MLYWRGLPRMTQNSPQLISMVCLLLCFQMTGCNVGNKELILLSDALAKNTNANELDLSNNLVFSVVEFLL